MTVNESTTQDHINSFQQHFQNHKEPNQTLLDVIGRSTEEVFWQQLLTYFLRPANGHGLEADILETFLRTVEDNTSISRLIGPLETIRVDAEVQTQSKKRVDLFLTQEDEWFLCLELKVHAKEHDGQTVAYVETDYIGTRAKSSFPPEGHHYLYIAADAADQPTAEQFEHLTWAVLEEQWRDVLEQRRSDDGSYPTRGVAQFAEFLAMLRAEAGEPLTGMETYYRDIPTAKRAYEDLARSLAAELEEGVRARTERTNALRVRRKPGRTFPTFEQNKDRLEIDKPLWQAGRSKPTIMYEFNFHLHPYYGPGETIHRPSIAVNLDIRGGATLKQELREDFKNRVDANQYRPHGFGQPHTNPKWHFLSKEVLLDETETPISDLLEAFDIIREFESILDSIAERD